MSEAIATPAEAAIGHNLPPEPTPFERLKERAEKCVDVANRWANERPEIKTEEDAEKAADFLRQLRALVSGDKALLEVARKAENKPHEDVVKANNERYRPVVAKVKLAFDLVRKLNDVWLVKKQAAIDAAKKKAADEAEAARKSAEEAQRKVAQETGGDVIGRQFEAEEAKRKADEAERVAAQAQKATAKTGSAYGARSVSLRTRTIIEIKDVTKIPAKTLKQLCDKPYVREALERALRENIAVAKALPEEAVTVRDEKYTV
jgi:colicin import membrane protein